jgi:hypothetical protein
MNENSKKGWIGKVLKVFSVLKTVLKKIKLRIDLVGITFEKSVICGVHKIKFV